MERFIWVPHLGLVWPYHLKIWKKAEKYNFHSFVQFHSSGEGYIRVIVVFLGENRPEFDSLETARLLPSLQLSFYRPSGRAQTSLEKAEIANMHSPGTNKNTR